MRELSNGDGDDEMAGVTVSTFNLLCPAYRRVSGCVDVIREEAYPDRYKARTDAILSLPMWGDSDIICCQEFWYGKKSVFELYIKALAGGYRLHGLQRPDSRRRGPTGEVRRERPDGLFMAVSREWEVAE